MKKRSLGVRIFIDFIIFLMIIGVLLLLFYNLQSINNSNKFLKVPTVVSTIFSDIGTPNIVSTNFTVEVKAENADSVDTKAVSLYIKRIMDNLDYNKIKGKDNLNYIRDEVIGKLESMEGYDKIEGIYITDIISGNSRIPLGGGTNDEKGNMDLYKGLFPNIK